jgi:hypothetical protein
MSAASSTSPGAIHALRAKTLAAAYLFANDAGTAQGVNEATDGQKQLDALLPAAITEAKRHDDLIAALKAFYIAAKTYFDSALTPVPMPSYDIRFGSRPSPEAIQLKATQAKLKASLDAKANALQLEAKFAGIDG